MPRISMRGIEAPLRAAAPAAPGAGRLAAVLPLRPGHHQRAGVGAFLRHVLAAREEERVAGLERGLVYRAAW